MISRIQRAVVRLSLIHGPQPRPTVSFFAFAVFIVKTLALTSTVRGAPQLASFNLPVAHGFVTPTRHSSLYRRFSGRVPPLMISASDLSQYGPKGSAARPLDKKRVAIFGVGGYLGSTIFGFLQRASSLYGPGISSQNSPRGIISAGAASMSLNSLLSKSFKLAYASENLVALTDIQDEDFITKRLVGFDVAIIGTRYTATRTKVTLNSYEKSPNDKTYELYLDQPRGGDIEDDPAGMAEDFHINMFRRTIRAAIASKSIRHVFVVATPATAGTEREYATVLDDEMAGNEVNFTYIRTGSETEMVNCRDYTFERGVLVSPDNLKVRGSTLAKGYRGMEGYESGDWMSVLLAVDEDNNDTGGVESKKKGPCAREDLAALVVQAVQSLDWSKSRVLDVSCTEMGLPNSVWKGVSNADLNQDRSMRARAIRSDNDWCINSNILAKKLMLIE
mmetsp:Transcript_1144/g.2284  ORF Transcript_1144/g.2284 Transcript_1144/m.2284 type:complete len:448 (-) Transcript_1144:283-1626(-)